MPTVTYHGLRLTHGQYRWAICDRCQGSGAVDNPAFSNGITSSEWAEWDPEDRQDYLAGRYDVPCSGCHGSGKVVVPIVAALPYGDRRLLVEARRERRWRDQAAWESERRARYADTGYPAEW